MRVVAVSITSISPPPVATTRRDPSDDTASRMGSSIHSESRISPERESTTSTQLFPAIAAYNRGRRVDDDGGGRTGEVERLHHATRHRVDDHRDGGVGRDRKQPFAVGTRHEGARGVRQGDRRARVFALVATSDAGDPVPTRPPRRYGVRCRCVRCRSPRRCRGSVRRSRRHGVRRESGRSGTPWPR